MDSISCLRGECVVPCHALAHVKSSGLYYCGLGEDEERGEAEGDRRAALRVDAMRLRMAMIQEQRLLRHRDMARQLQCPADAHFYDKLLMWCYDSGVFIHPSLVAQRRHSMFRDHAFYVSGDVPRLTPLLAVPESLVIGFKQLHEDDRNILQDKSKEDEFNRLNAGDSDAADICSFFFSSLNMMVSDLVTARGSALTDARYPFAQLLDKVRTLHNAPYFSNDVVMRAPETGGEEASGGLADVLLEMIRNYINAGPLVNKVPKDQLRWLVSVCLSHSTPLTIGPHTSIGIIPFVHLFPHGGDKTNTFLVTHRTEGSHNRLSRFLRRHCGLDFSKWSEGKWIFLVPARDLKKGEEVAVQAMAPVCDADREADEMWRLSCGATPEHYLSSAQVERQRRKLEDEMTRRDLS